MYVFTFLFGDSHSGTVPPNVGGGVFGLSGLTTELVVEELVASEFSPPFGGFPVAAAGCWPSWLEGGGLTA